MSSAVWWHCSSNRILSCCHWFIGFWQPVWNPWIECMRYMYDRYCKSNRSFIYSKPISFTFHWTNIYTVFCPFFPCSSQIHTVDQLAFSINAPIRHSPISIPRSCIDKSRLIPDIRLHMGIGIRCGCPSFLIGTLMMIMIGTWTLNSNCIRWQKKRI